MTHHANQSVFLRGSPRAKVVAAVEAALAGEGFRRAPSDGLSRGSVRILVRGDEDALVLTLQSDPAFVFKPVDAPSAWVEGEWAAHLARTLVTPTLAIRILEGGEGTALTRFSARGMEAASTGSDDAEAFTAELVELLAIPRPWLDLWDSDLRAGDELLVFRGAEVKNTRKYAVGAFGYGPETDLESVSEVVSELLRAFSPKDGLRVEVSRGERTEVLPIRFSRTASIKGAQLARGGSLRFSAGSFVCGPGLPLFWVSNEPNEALRFGFQIERPGAAKPEEAISIAMATIAEVASDIEGCVSAVVTAQSDAASPSEASTAWRVLVPTAQVPLLKRPPPDGVSLERCSNGVLVKVDTDTPFTMGDTPAVTAWLAVALG